MYIQFFVVWGSWVGNQNLKPRGWKKRVHFSNLVTNWFWIAEFNSILAYIVPSGGVKLVPYSVAALLRGIAT